MKITKSFFLTVLGFALILSASAQNEPKTLPELDKEIEGYVNAKCGKCRVREKELPLRSEMI